MGRDAILLVNPQKPDAATAAREITTIINRHGRLIRELPADLTALPSEFLGTELVVVLGGDGTLLTQARRCAHPRTSMLGVNMGRLGFLAEFDMPALREQAETLFGDGMLSIREHPLLSVEVWGVGERTPKFTGLSLNEAAIVAGPPYRMIQIDLSVDAQEGPTINGDGVIISTPLGSTAYNLSAGGPIMSPLVDALAITPIAAHSVSVRPVVVAGNAKIEVHLTKVNREADGLHGTTLVLDGQVYTPLSHRDRVVVSRHSTGVRFVQNPRSGYWKRLTGKLHWAVAPRLS